MDTVRFTSTARVPLCAHEILSALPATGAVTRTGALGLVTTLLVMEAGQFAVQLAQKERGGLNVLGLGAPQGQQVALAGREVPGMEGCV